MAIRNIRYKDVEILKTRGNFMVEILLTFLPFTKIIG